MLTDINRVVLIFLTDDKKANDWISTNDCINAKKLLKVTDISLLISISSTELHDAP